MTANDDITIKAGEKLYDADVTMNTTRTFTSISKAEQLYRVTGPSMNEGQDSIVLIGQEGPIRFTTPADQQILASGYANYRSSSARCCDC